MAKEVRIPDIGDAEGVEVIDVLVSEGDEVEKEDSLITLESDKAAMDVPAPFAGKVAEVKVKTGDKVSEGDVILTVEESGKSDDGGKKDREEQPEAKEKGGDDPEAKEEKSGESGNGEEDAQGGQADGRDEGKGESSRGEDEENGEADKGENRQGKQDDAGPKRPAPGAEPIKEKPPTVDRASQVSAHAGPSVRKFARELGVDLSKVKGSGHKERITHNDVKLYVKSALRGGAAGDAALPAVREVDYSRFGEVETKPLSRIKRLSGPYLQASWINVPHVTQQDEADMTTLEAVRKAMNAGAGGDHAKVTLLAFLVHASVLALKAYPTANSALDAAGENLIERRYFHIGFAVDTEQGLVVPVIHDADKKGIRDIAAELSSLAEKARDGKLKRDEIEGACFSITSLGGIGGTAFTPIVNAPEVAILGVSRAEMKPKWNGRDFEPRLMLPLSLSYDHRVIDGAMAVRITRHLAETVETLRGLVG
ncbi:MAG: 2-oxo acid dehydrogenase subunit E2 [Gammaproteobacteria bacterium]|nr:2-oxo acid dehydrogenase subunit E2 [Gammaproteobacteria bacterium]